MHVINDLLGFFAMGIFIMIVQQVVYRVPVFFLDPLSSTISVLQRSLNLCPHRKHRRSARHPAAKFLPVGPRHHLPRSYTRSHGRHASTTHITRISDTESLSGNAVDISLAGYGAIKEVLPIIIFSSAAYCAFLSDKRSSFRRICFFLHSHSTFLPVQR